MKGTKYEWLLKNAVAANVGPDAKEFFLLQADLDYREGRVLQSIFFQTRALFHTFHERHTGKTTNGGAGGDDATDDKQLSADEWRVKMMNDAHKLTHFLDYTLKQICEERPLKAGPTKKPPRPLAAVNATPNCLADVLEPLDGVRRIASICSRLPAEWTVLQLCKGFRPETTHSVFRQNIEGDAPIYLTLLRHHRSAALPEPVCLRFADPDGEQQLYKHLGRIGLHMKNRILVNPKDYTEREMKRLYWKGLDELNTLIKSSVDALSHFLYPWTFLFAGSPNFRRDSDLHANVQQRIYDQVDRLVARHKWDNTTRVLLSLAALHRNALRPQQVDDLCRVLLPAADSAHQQEARELLLSLLPAHPPDDAADDTPNRLSPCLLIVDERLDHFFWEELNVRQEFSRFDSLQRLWDLYQWHRPAVRDGYLVVRVDDGAGLINPDNNLAKTQLRMRRFFDYWLPHWVVRAGDRPTSESVFGDLLQRPCFVYAGHGSGLQFVDGRRLLHEQVRSVVFLFGCDSSKLSSNGLYSEMVGPHLYYHQARCPALVGTLLPGLDSYMDTVAAEILSRWIRPKRPKEVLQWQLVDTVNWRRTGEINVSPDWHEADDGANTMDDCSPSDYHMGSLCGIVARIHRRHVEKTFYNTVGYVCRGLPVWNSDVATLPP